MPRLIFINTDGEELQLDADYGDLGDAAGDLNGGDALNELVDIHGEKAKYIREIRIVNSSLSGSDVLLELNTD